MEILFIGVACTEDAIEESNRKYYDTPQIRPQQYFDLALTKGLAKHCNVLTLTLPPVGSYPKSSCWIYNRKSEKPILQLEISYITLINLPIIKNIIIMITTFFRTLVFLIENRKKNPVVLCGYISFQTAFPALLAARITKKNIFTIVPDAPKFIPTYTKINNLLKIAISNFFIYINRKIEIKFDGYVFLTHQMNELINQNQKPYIVVEGMVQVDDYFFEDKKGKSYPKVVMYAGTLHEKFGIWKLVEAFIASNLQDCELWIYGNGDIVKKIEKISEENSNIKYKGNASKSHIFEMERKATLLVNPRPSTEEFTKYSFPSKTLEYMVSGTPLLTTRLSGIPKDYDRYLYYFTEESVIEMAEMLKIVMFKSKKELDDFGSKSREFVINNKNNNIQAEKIFKFMKKMSTREQ